MFLYREGWGDGEKQLINQRLRDQLKLVGQDVPVQRQIRLIIKK